MSAALSKLKPGDSMILRRGQSGAASGLYLVVELFEDRVTVQGVADGQIWTAPLAEIEADIVGHYPTARPNTGAVTLAPRLAPKVEPAAPRQEPPGRFVKVHLIGARAEGKTIGRKLDDGRLVNKHYTPAPIPVMVDQAGQGHFEIGHLDDSGQWQEGVDAIDLGKFLQLDGAHTAESCGKVAVFASRDPQFSEDS